MKRPGRRDVIRASLGGGIALLPWASRAVTPQDPTAATSTAQRPPERPERIALVLGAGSARGFAHIGAMKSLAQAGLKPDLVVGTSAGALIGAFYAAGYSPWQIEEVALRTREAEIADFISTSKRGMLNGDALWNFVDGVLKGARIESLRTRFAAVATDLRSGELVVFREGPVADAVRASCSMPGIFVPREVAGRELVDGALVAPVPVRTARQLGCDAVVAVDVGTKPNRNALPSLYEVLLQSFEIMGRALADHELSQADLVVRPDTSNYASSDFGVRREMIQHGYEAGQRVVPELKKLLDGSRRRRRG